MKRDYLAELGEASGLDEAPLPLAVILIFLGIVTALALPVIFGLALWLLWLEHPAAPLVLLLLLAVSWRIALKVRQ